MAYTVLKVCCAVYLSWLGLQLLIRSRSSFSDDDNNVSQGSWFAALCGGSVATDIGRGACVVTAGGSAAAGATNLGGVLTVKSMKS